MRAITLHEPWATCVALERKPFETRSWPPPHKLIYERIAIHAGKTVDEDYLAHFDLSPDEIHPGCVVCTAVLRGAYRVGALGAYQFLVMPEGPFGDGKPAARGASTVCLATATDCRTDEYGDYSVGRWIWWLTNIQPLNPPIEAVGHQGIWEWTRA